MVYNISRFLASLLLHLLFFLKVNNKEKFKYVKGCIYIANHKSNWDPLVLGVCVKNKPVCYLAKEELFSKKVAAKLLKELNAIPIARAKGDIHAVKVAISTLKQDKSIGIFPEGTRSKNGELLAFEHGAALIAMKAKVPIIPVYIRGNYKLFKQINVFTGDPIYVDKFIEGKKSGEAAKAITAYLEQTMKEMQQWEK